VLATIVTAAEAAARVVVVVVVVLVPVSLQKSLVRSLRGTVLPECTRSERIWLLVVELAIELAIDQADR
jgi:hypothetical protein